MRILSADWVLPVEGEPIENGAVAIEDGAIAAVGPASELGEGERFPDSAIVPGFVNAHTHLEYAVYAGFGDGLSFGPWISMHIERKQRLERADMEAIARLGAAECLRSGITTVGDLAFTGASAHACAELGLRAIVYLEVFGREGADALRQFDEKRAYVDAALSELVRVGVSPHAPYTCSRDVYAACMTLDLPVATHLNESQDELDWLLRGEGPWQPLAEMLVEPEGMSGIRSLAAAGLLDERVAAAHCVKVDPEEIGLLARHGGRRHPLPALERSPRLRDRTARRAARRRAPGRRRHRRRLLRPVTRLLRGAAHRDRTRAGALGAGRRALGDRGARACDPRRRPRARDRGGDGLAGRRQACRSRGGLAFWLSVSTMGGSGSRRRLRRLARAGHSYSGRRPDEVRERRKRMARADRRSVRSPRSHAAARKRDSDLVAIEDTMFFSRLRRHAKWMFVFLALVFAVGFVGFGIGANQNASLGDLFRGDSGTTSGNLSVGDAREQLRESPKSAQAKRDLATALQEDGQTSEAITVLSGYVEQSPKDEDALRELAGLYLARANALAQDAQIAQLRASYLTFGSTFSVPLDLGNGASLGPDPIDEAISTLASQEVSAAYSKAQTAYQNAESTYDKLAAVAPRDPNVQLELAQAAQQSGNVTKAIAAYQRFLVLAPDDPSAEIVKQQIEQLKATQTPAGSG